MTTENKPTWPHAPLHRLSSSGTYMVTAGTYLKQHLFKADDRLDLLQNSLLTLAKAHGWHLQSWAIFSNHYHFIANSPESAGSLPDFLSQLHATTARHINSLDNAPERMVWYNYRDTLLTYPHSYFARLNYVNQNPVKHGLVKEATQYRWCSASWFEESAPVSFKKSIAGFKIDKLKISDDY